MRTNRPDAPLGVFDSGVGGLTVVGAINSLLPRERIVYLGDTARVPYGNKSPAIVTRYALQDARFLMDRGVKAIVVACNTATAFALAAVEKAVDVPVIGVLEPGVEAALARTRNRRIGIIGTAGTIRSEAYQKAIAARCPGAHIRACATPLLVPLIEEGWLDHEVTRLVLAEYLGPMLGENIDTLVLACTHYPLLTPLLQRVAGDGIALVDSASTCAEHLARRFAELGLAAREDSPAGIEIYVTDRPTRVASLAKRFLKAPIYRIAAAELPE